MHRSLLIAIGLWAALGGESAPRAELVMVEKVWGQVGFYDAAGRRLAGIKAGIHPHEMVYSPDRRRLYVTNNGILWMTESGAGENTVQIIDVAARRSLGFIDLGSDRRPHGIDIDPATGNLLVTTELPSALLVVDPRSRKILRRYDVKGEAPHIVVLGPDRRWAFVSNTNTGAVGAVNLETGEVTLIPAGSRPQGAVLSPDRKTLYVTNSGPTGGAPPAPGVSPDKKTLDVANAGGGDIVIIDVATRKRVGTIPTGKAPVRIVASPDGGTLVYALQLGEAVGFADVKSRKEIGQVSLTGQPVSMTLSADGRHVYSSVQAQDKVFMISIADRKIVRVIETPKGSGPDPVFPLP